MTIKQYFRFDPVFLPDRTRENCSFDIYEATFSARCFPVRWLLICLFVPPSNGVCWRDESLPLADARCYSGCHIESISSDVATVYVGESPISLGRLLDGTSCRWESKCRTPALCRSGSTCEGSDKHWMFSNLRWTSRDASDGWTWRRRKY